MRQFPRHTPQSQMLLPIDPSNRPNINIEVIMNTPILNSQPSLATQNRLSITSHLERLGPNPHSHIRSNNPRRNINANRSIIPTLHSQCSRTGQHSRDKNTVAEHVGTHWCWEVITGAHDALGRRSVPVHDFVCFHGRRFCSRFVGCNIGLE